MNPNFRMVFYWGGDGGVLRELTAFSFLPRFVRSEEGMGGGAKRAFTGKKKK